VPCGQLYGQWGGVGPVLRQPVPARHLSRDRTLLAGGGNPLAGDGRNVFHAIGLSLTAPDGQEWRMAMDHTPIFPVADPQSFQELQIASTPDPKTGKPDPTKMKPYLARHPETKAFQDYIMKAPLPASFATATYYSINAFRFTDAAGTTRFVRWQIVPEATGPISTRPSWPPCRATRCFRKWWRARRKAHRAGICNWWSPIRAM
jgi:hypothetical protein